MFDGFTILHYFLFAPDAIDSLKIIGDINNTLGCLLAVSFCISRLPRSWWKRETRAAITSMPQAAQLRVPFWIAVVFSINVIERGAYMYYDMIHTEPVLDWPSIFLLPAPVSLPASGDPLSLQAFFVLHSAFAASF